MRTYQTRIRLTAACGLLALGGLAAMPAYSAAPDTGKTVSLDVAGGDLHAVVTMLERQAHIEASVRDGDAPFKPVNVHLEDASLAKAMRTIALSARARVSLNADGIYVFEPESSDGGEGVLPESPRTSAPEQPPVQYANGNPEAGFAPGALGYHEIVLQHETPNNILKIMGWDRYIVDTDPFKPVQMPQSVPSVSSTQPIRQSGLNQPSSPYDGGGYPSVPIGTGNAGPASANYSAQRSANPEQANQFPGGFNGGGFGGGGFGGAPGGFGGVPGGFGGTTNPFAAQPFQPNGPGGRAGAGAQAPLPTGVARMLALQSNNTIVVEATPEGYNLVKQIVKFLDVAPRQVQVKVEFVTASVTDVDALGINFDLVPYPGLEVSSSQGSGAFGGTVSGLAPTFLQYATGNIAAQLFQTLTRTRGKVVQAPIITTTNNVQATIQVNTQIPFFTNSVVSNGGVAGGTTTGNQANFLTLQTGLTITPRINSDDTVTMNLQPVITDTTGQPSVNGVPPTVQQTLTTLRTVHSGDTMVLGGLVRKQESASSQRIPILADIPYLGGLFRTRNKQINDQELLIFVTPVIINDSNDSGAANANGGQNISVAP